MNKRGIALIFAFMLFMPLSFAFDGTGDGYNLSVGVFGYGVGTGTGDGYNLTVGAYPDPVGAGSGDGFTVNFRHFFSESELDANPPIVTLISPGNWTVAGSTSVTFTYTVSDTSDIVNCTVSIVNEGGTSIQSSSNITNNAQNSFTINLGNSFYNWSVSCTDDSTAHNIGTSETWILTVNYQESGSTKGGCTDECALGERKCRDGSVWVCGNFDSDRCSEWELQYCDDGATCIDGYCTALSCVENWVCDEWSDCSDSKQVRKCADWDDCGTTEMKPPEVKNCVMEKEPEKEIPSSIITHPKAPVEPKEPSKFMEGVKKTAKYRGISLGVLTALIIAILGASMLATKTTVFLKNAFSAEAFVGRMLAAGVPEIKIIEKAARKGFKPENATKIVRNKKIDKLNDEIEKLSKSVESDMPPKNMA
jgi:hypothetical protein